MDPDTLYVAKDKKPTKVMVWGAISHDGKSALHMYDEADWKQYKTKSGKTARGITEGAYMVCLQKAFLRSVKARGYLWPEGVPDKWIFQQDGAPSHAGEKVTQQILKGCPDGVHVLACKVGNASLEKWPANSPDLNLIENLWSYFQDKVAKARPRTSKEFYAKLEDCWWNESGDGVEQAYIRKLYKSMTRRLHAVVAANGDMTKY